MRQHRKKLDTDVGRFIFDAARPKVEEVPWYDIMNKVLHQVVYESNSININRAIDRRIREI